MQLEPGGRIREAPTVNMENDVRTVTLPYIRNITNKIVANASSFSENDIRIVKKLPHTSAYLLFSKTEDKTNKLNKNNI